jgi:hypothetical protein
MVGSIADGQNLILTQKRLGSRAPSRPWHISFDKGLSVYTRTPVMEIAASAVA